MGLNTVLQGQVRWNSVQPMRDLVLDHPKQIQHHQRTNDMEKLLRGLAKNNAPKVATTSVQLA